MPYKKKKKRKHYHQEYNKKYRARNIEFVKRVCRIYGCQICGYKRCSDALCFHHLNPENKTAHISKLVRTSSLKIIKEEIRKCILLCQNCHSEVHAGMHDEVIRRY
jgi:hypothetical protein